MIKAVIFDMDGVLVDTEPIQERVWETFFAGQGISVKKDDVPKMKGLRAIDVIKLFMPHVGEDLINGLVDKRRAIYRKMLHDNPPSKIKGVTEFVQSLKELKLKIAVATSAVKEIADMLIDSAQLKQYMDIVISGEAVVSGKPDPEIYIKTAQRLGVDPKECLVFEDAISGVKAAQAAGMKVAVLLTSHHKEDFPSAKLFFNDFTQINPAELLEAEE